MNLIGLTHAKPADRKAIGVVLGAILDQTWREHGVALTLIVRRNAAGRSRCGPGFFKLVAGLTGLPDWNDEAELVGRETERVWKFYAKPRRAKENRSVADNLEKQFDVAMMNIYHRAKSEAKYTASIFFNMVNTKGGLLTAKQLVNSKEPSE